MKVRYIASAVGVYCMMSGCADTTSPHERSIDELQEEAMRQVAGAEAEASRVEVEVEREMDREPPDRK